MFKQMKNIDTAFRHVRVFTLVVVIACTLLCIYMLYRSYTWTEASQQRIYILANGKALEAYAADRKDNIPVEARDHVRTFHQLFFTLDPDEQVIEAHITRALYLADGSANREYDNLKESGYYTNLIAGNISQQITVDSVSLDLEQYPHRFRCYGTQQIIRATSITRRKLITEGQLRNVNRSDHNAHGFLIERWTTIDNSDIETKNR